MKKYRNSADKAALLQAWQNSNLTQIAFCQQHQIGKSTFYKWRKQLANCESASGAITASSTNIKFLAINNYKQPKPSHDSANTHLIEITTPNGCHIKTSLTSTNVKLLLQELMQWK